MATLEWDSDDERSEREYIRKRLAHEGYQPHPAHVREQAERMDKLAVEDPEAFDAAWEELRKLGRLG